MIIKRDIIYNEFDQKLDVYLPENEPVKAVFVFFHGGGIVEGSKESATDFSEYLINNNTAIVSANYRLFPKTKFPEFIEDAAAAVKWTFDNRKLFGGCDKIFLGGSSAGGYISMMLCFDKRYLEKFGIKPTDIAGYVHDSGQPTDHFTVLKYSGVDSRRVIIDEKSPLYFVGLDKEYSPMIFLVADNDMQNRYEQTMLMLSTLKHFGYDDKKIDFMLIHGTHCAHCSAKEKDGTSVFGKIIYDFISKRI